MVVDYKERVPIQHSHRHFEPTPPWLGPVPPHLFNTFARSRKNNKDDSQRVQRRSQESWLKKRTGMSPGN